jgi:uncharacterized protein (UPF0332 family)
LNCLEGLEARSEGSLLIALLLLLEIGERIHLEVVVALEELFNKVFQVLHKYYSKIRKILTILTSNSSWPTSFILKENSLILVWVLCFGM